MKTLKKLVSFALACVLALSMLTACGGSSGSSFIDDLNKELEPAKITVSHDGALDEKAVKLAAYLEAYAEENGIERFDDLYSKIGFMEKSEREALMKDAGLDPDSETMEAYTPVLTECLMDLADDIVDGVGMGYKVKAIGYTDASILDIKCRLVVSSYDKVETSK